jgi:hypothetical protein
MARPCGVLAQLRLEAPGTRIDLATPVDGSG